MMVRPWSQSCDRSHIVACLLTASIYFVILVVCVTLGVFVTERVWMSCLHC